MKKFLDYNLLEFGEYKLNVVTIIILLAIIFFSMLLLYLFKKAIYKSKKIDAGKKYSIYNLFKYFALLIIFIICMQTVGLDLSVLLAGSAALLVGVGLGLQNLFSDFISGIILLMDASIKVNDIIDVNGLVCKVQEIKLRTTTVLTRDDKYIILPNTILTKNQLINWTHSEVDSRFEVAIGVDYSSDVTLVMKTLKEVIDLQEGVLSTPVPFVRFAEYADSSLQFSIFFWTKEVFRVENIKSEIRVRIFEYFKEKNINIPFPQRVVHLKNEIPKAAN